MKVIKIIGGLVIVIVVALIVAIVSLPSTAHMERSIVIEAKPAAVYNELISFRNFNTWSPWTVKDTTTRYSYEGPEVGVGAKMSWQSNIQDVGSGYMEIVEEMENKRVTNVMSFDGYEGKPTATFLLKPVSKGTEVTWTYDETNVSGLNKLFMLGIDGFLGEDYEKGLERLKKRVESAPAFQHHITVEDMNRFSYVGIKDSVLNDPSMISAKMAQNYGELVSFLGNRGIETSGHPLAIYSSYNDQEVAFICAIPVKDSVNIEEESEILIGESYGGLVLKSKAIGGSNDVGQVYREMEKYADFYNYQPAGNLWEEYVTDPEREPDTSQWITHIYLPVK